MEDAEAQMVKYRIKLIYIMQEIRFKIGDRAYIVDQGITTVCERASEGYVRCQRWSSSSPTFSNHVSDSDHSIAFTPLNVKRIPECINLEEHVGTGAISEIVSRLLDPVCPSIRLSFQKEYDVFSHRQYCWEQIIPPPFIDKTPRQCRPSKLWKQLIQRWKSCRWNVKSKDNLDPFVRNGPFREKSSSPKESGKAVVRSVKGKLEREIIKRKETKWEKEEYCL
jgi:hypothetical protein